MYFFHMHAKISTYTVCSFSAYVPYTCIAYVVDVSACSEQTRCRYVQTEVGLFVFRPIALVFRPITIVFRPITIVFRPITRIL